MIRIDPLNSTKFLEDFKSSKIYLDLKKDYDLMDADPNKFNQGKFKIVCFDSNAFGRASPDGDIKIVFEK